MHRHRDVLLATTITLIVLSACSSDTPAASDNTPAPSNNTPASSNTPETTAAPAVSAPPSSDAGEATVCATGDAGDRKTVIIDVDDDSDGFGRFGLKTPTPLPTGSIRLALNSVEDNTDPVSVTITGTGGTVFEFIAVAPGVVCAADVDLAAGDYTVSFGEKSKTFTVDSAS